MERLRAGRQGDNRMSDTADMFKKLAQGRIKPTSAESDIKTKEESQSALNIGLNKKTSATSQAKVELDKKTTLEPSSVGKPHKKTTAIEESSKRRGRPATGKRSDPDWIGRTYYIRRETDFDIEDELIKLKRSGINLDKSELVDFLLAAWVKWRKGENIEIQISEITPRRK